MTHSYLLSGFEHFWQFILPTYHQQVKNFKARFNLFWDILSIYKVNLIIAICQKYWTIQTYLRQFIDFVSIMNKLLNKICTSCSSLQERTSKISKSDHHDNIRNIEPLQTTLWQCIAITNIIIKLLMNAALKICLQWHTKAKYSKFAITITSVILNRFEQ